MGLFDNLRGRRHAGPEPDAQRDAPQTCLTGTGRDLDGLEANDRPVKIHLAEPIRTALDELADYYESNLSIVVRHILYLQLYGFYELVARTERGKGDFLPYKVAMADMIARYSIAESGQSASESTPQPSEPDLGKNLDNIKIYLPHRMVDDIDQIAEQMGKNRSGWIREILITHLFGRIQLPQKP
jgi:hypothetical protein